MRKDLNERCVSNMRILGGDVQGIIDIKENLARVLEQLRGVENNNE